MTAGAGVTYFYDGDGRRVRKSNGKLYWYGMSSDALVETDNAGASYTEFVFFGGKRIARRDNNAAVFYYFADHLGSSRVLTNSSGTVVEDSDFYPFGGERVVVNNDPNPYKFTGKERDTESGLDYFIARYYSSAYGRFLSPDEFTGGPVDAYSSNDPLPPGPLPYALITNPQSLNKYSYAYNQPLKYIDPDGHDVTVAVVEASVAAGSTASSGASVVGAVAAAAKTGVAAGIVVGAASLLFQRTADVLVENARGREQLAAIESQVSVENAAFLTRSATGEAIKAAKDLVKQGEVLLESAAGGAGGLDPEKKGSNELKKDLKNLKDKGVDELKKLVEKVENATGGKAQREALKALQEGVKRAKGHLKEIADRLTNLAKE